MVAAATDGGNAFSGWLVSASVTIVRKRMSSGVGVRGSGFVSFRRVLCVGSVEGAEKKHSVGAAGSESRVPRLVGKGCKLIGCGSAKHALQVSNDDLAEIVETSDEWISVRTGIRKQKVLSAACWSLFALHVVKGIIQIRTGKLEPLFAQELVDCCPSSNFE